MFPRSCNGRNKESSVKLVRDHFKRLSKYGLKKTLQQMVNFWNLLPEDILEAENTSRFKQSFDKFVNASP